MRAVKLKLEPFSMITITDYSSGEQIGQHGVVHIIGKIDKKNYSKCMEKAGKKQWTQVIAIDEYDNEKTLFWGVLYSIHISLSSNYSEVDMYLRTGTCLMDMTKHYRSFQKSSYSYQDVLKVCTKEYDGGNFIMGSGKDKKCGNFLMQYYETDWEFANRLASTFYTVLIPESRVKGVRYYFGIPNKKAVKTIAENDIEATIVQKGVGEQEDKIKNNVKGLKEKDSVVYIIKSRELFYLGDNVMYENQSYVISQIQRVYEGSELINFYYLQTKAGTKVIQKWNENLIGNSVSGEVVNVKSDVVEVKLFQDENQKETGTRWFPFSTVYSSPDGTGWYCMPEIKDNVRLYFPDSKEKNAYVISAVHTSPSNSAARSNPDHKSIMNKDGKELLLTPDSIVMTNNKGMSVEIKDDTGISIVSTKDIKITADESIYIASTNKEVDIVADEKILLDQDGTSITLENDITLLGSKIKYQ